ncbi:hypothetical protein ACSTI9_00050, partial [Vibrio parahaemolyticus]
QEEDEDIHVLKQVSWQDFIKADAITQILKQNILVEFGYKPYFATSEIELNTKPQPAFNRQFDLLIKDL